MYHIFNLSIQIAGIITLSLGMGYLLQLLCQLTIKAIKKSLTKIVEGIVLTYLKSLQNDDET